MPRLIQPYNPNEQHQHPLLFDNAVPIRNVPEYNVGMGTYTRASQMRDAVLRFSSSPQLQTNEAEATRYIAMILASTQMPVYKVTVNNQTRRIVLNRDFNNLFNQLLEDPAVQVMAHDFATNREYRENMLNQNGVFSRDHFLQSLVTGYRTFDDPQAAQENNQPQNANIEVNPNNQQNVQANQENIQNQNQNAELDDDDEPFPFVENFDEVERQRQQNQQQNRQPNRPQINIGQPARDIEGPHIDLDAIYRGLGPQNQQQNRPQVNIGRPAQDIEGPHIDLDAIYRGLGPQNPPPQNQNQQNQNLQDQQEPLMGSYDPNEQHIPPKVLDNNIVPGGLPVYNGQQAEPALQTYTQVRTFHTNPDDIFSNPEMVRIHIAGALTLSQMTLYRQQTEAGDVPVYDLPEFNQRFDRYHNDPVVAEMAQRFVQDPQYRQNLISDQNGVSSDAFIKNSVSEFRNQTLALQQQNQNLQANQENLQNPGQVNIDRNQPVDIEGPHIDPNPPVINQPNLNQNLNQNQELNQEQNAELDDDDDEPFHFVENFDEVERQRQQNQQQNRQPNRPQINIGQPARDIEGPHIDPDSIYRGLGPRNPAPLNPEEDFVFEENFEGANDRRQQEQPRRRERVLNIENDEPQIRNEQPQNNLRDGWVMGDAENQQVGNLDDLLNQQNLQDQNQQNQPDQNPQNQDQQEPLMAPYDPNEQHYPSRVLDNHLIADGGLPIFNGQQAEPALQAFSQVRNFPNNPQNAFANEELVRNHIAGTLTLSEMTLFHAQMPEGDVPVYDRQEFDQRYNRFWNDPAVAEMSRRFVQDPQYRQSLLSDQNGVSADAFIKNTVSEFRNQTLALRQQNQANREEEEAENDPNHRVNLRYDQNGMPVYEINPNRQQNLNQQPNPQQNLQQPNPNPQVQEMDINQLNAMFVDPNMDLEGNVLDNEDNPILNQNINQNIQPNQNLQNQNPQFNQNIQQQNLQQNIQQPGPQQNQPNPLPNQNQNQNQQILPDGNGAITYRQYMDMVAESIQGDAEAAVRDNVVANMLAAQMLIGDNPNRPVDWTMLRQVSERFSRQESFKEMLRDRPQDVRHAMMQNDAVALVGLLAQAETARNQRLEVYRRPQDRVQDDSALLQNALDSVKKKSGKSKSPAKAEKRNPLYQQMINKWAHLRRVTESGTQPTGFQVKELIDVTQRYINGGSNIAGGNQPDLRPAAFKEAMCVLKRYMPEEEFNAYCTNINLAQHVDVVEPSAFLPGRLTGYAVTGEELMNETRKALKKNQTPELYATVMAIHNLTKGRIGLIVNPADVEKEAQRLLKPGSGLNRTLQDPQSRARLDALAKDGSAKNLAQTLESHTLDHVARTASGQFKLAQRMLTSGPLNRYFASKSLSMLLAAHRAASHSDAGTIINNRGFREKAEEIERDPKFHNLLDQYMNDLEFRNRINRELSNPNATAMELELQLERQQRNLRINRNPVREAQERHYDPRNMRPHRAMALDNGVGANGLPEFRGQNYSLSDPMVRQVHSFAGQPAANEQEALRIFAGALALSKSPVFRISENGRQEKVVDTDQFNQLFNNYRNDPAVQRMARDFAANPQYRERILHGNNERTPEGMITNISKELIALKRQEAQANRQQNQQVPQNQQINPNLQNQQINPNRQAPQDQQIPVNQNGQPNLQQNRQNIRQRREEMALQNPYL